MIDYLIEARVSGQGLHCGHFILGPAIREMDKAIEAAQLALTSGRWCDVHLLTRSMGEIIQREKCVGGNTDDTSIVPGKLKK